MDAAAGGRRRRVDGSDPDRISSLPDDLLHIILAFLRSTPAAACTSVLSRRWRHVWAQLPELLLENISPPGSIVDAALAACAASTLRGLTITMPNLAPADHLTPGRVSPWLRFASQRLAGKL
ncbi:hypothetical protein ACP70R_036500 [Stipagrostis hirtigluma subsp. patula]